MTYELMRSNTGWNKFPFKKKIIIRENVSMQFEASSVKQDYCKIILIKY